MTRKFITITALMLLGILAFSACSGSIPLTGGDGITQQDLIETQNVVIKQAAEATATQIAMETMIADLQTQAAGGGAQPIVITATPEPATATATATLEPTATNTPIPPTATVVLPTWTPSATPIPCNAAQFISDVSIPDGTEFAPGTTFTKTWRLKNVGSCTWTASYALAFDRGDQMSAASIIYLNGSVAPQQVIDISITLTAPSGEGSYRGHWKLRDEYGVLFGVGKSSASFYADIKVNQIESQYPLDFAATYCNAEWTSGSGRLPCPTGDGDSRGYVFRQEKAVLESGQIDDEPGLVTHPQMITDGVIRGKYPSFRVEKGHHFQSLVGCGNNQNSCDVRFQLDYQIGDGSIQTVQAWNERYEGGSYTIVDVDLSGLEGNNVKFILTVFANGSSSQDRLVWLAPRIVKVQ